ncbi:MAG: transporter substrate-binding domain-containing protein [Chloroflexi bacterium]|nr:transporter substrate-binding domain-containing protein [Chloroflexota bacterium]
MGGRTPTRLIGPPPFSRVWPALLIAALVFALTACAGEPEDEAHGGACTDGERALRVGFYAHFAPVSSSAGAEPGDADFDTHLGYEADLLSALEAMEGAGLSFERRAIGAWTDIWLLAASPEYDLVGGGITMLESRRYDGSGAEAIVFTSGHIAFRQSLLVRAEDRDRFPDHDALTSGDRVGALRNTTGEARLLRLTGLTDAEGVLAAGVQVETPRGEIVADGTDAYVITAAGASPALEGRQRLQPPSGDMPQAIYLGDLSGEAELLDALAEGTVDAVARGEIGNREAAHASGAAFVVTALDPAVEWGGFSLALSDAELARCIDAKIDYLTDERRIGYAQWQGNPDVFMRRAERWNQGR